MPRDIPAHVRYVQVDEGTAIDLDLPWMRALTQAGIDHEPDISLQTAAMLADHCLYLIRRAGLVVTDPHATQPARRVG